MSSLKILLLLTLLLSILLLRLYHSYRALPVYSDGEYVSLSGTVSEEPKLSFGKQRVKVRTADGLVFTAVTGPSPLYQYGITVHVEGVFTKEEYKEHSFWVAYFPKIQTLKNEQNIITGTAYFIRNEAKKLFQGTLPPASSSLLLGIVLGGKHGMPEPFLENLRTTGVMHVIAASGMNISFVAAFLVAVLGRVFSRRLTLFTAVLGIGFYVILAGFEPPIVRAAIMSTLTFAAAFLGRQSTGIWVLCITGYGMLMLSPSLIEDMGFQLSFLSTMGILLLKPIFDTQENKNNYIQALKDDIGTTISAQLATFPILLGAFGSYGILSILVNALILWMVPFLMSLGSLAIFTGIIFVPVGKLVLYLSYPFLWLFEAIVNGFGSVGLVIELPEVPLSLWIGYYLILAAFIAGNRKKIKQSKEQLVMKQL